MKARLLTLLLALLLTLPLHTAKAQVEDIDMRAILQEVCDDFNKDCPQEVDEDMYLLGLMIDDDNLVLYFLLTDDTDFSQWSQSEIDLYDQILEKDLIGDEGFDALREICSIAGYGLILKVEDSNENVMTTRVDVN